MHRFRSRILQLISLAATALLALASLPASAFTLQDMVGMWFTEIAEDSTYGGEPYDMRRQIEDNRADGTKSVTFRFYKSCKLVGEVINTHEWGVTNNVYWARCTAVIANGVSYPCAGIQEHDLLTAQGDTMSYKSRDSGTVYTHTRIGPDFKLPTSSCVGNIPDLIPLYLSHAVLGMDDAAGRAK